MSGNFFGWRISGGDDCFLLCFAFFEITTLISKIVEDRDKKKKVDGINLPVCHKVEKLSYGYY